jgi:adenine-specific DNA-methyltransferase
VDRKRKSVEIRAEYPSEESDASYHAPYRMVESDVFDNMIIHGDNLLALKALEAQFAGKVQCVYIDPPFNTDQAFEHYDDGVEHSTWLTLMRDRIDILHKLLHPTGSLFIHIDDSELAYLIALTDEIFGRKNRISIIAFKQSSASGPKAINPGLVTTSNFILYYAKDKRLWKSFKVFTATKRDARYSKYVECFDDGLAAWKIVSLKDAFCRYHQADWQTLRTRFAERRRSSRRIRFRKC